MIISDLPFMQKILFFLFCITVFISSGAFAQSALPNIAIKNYNGKIIISWQNNYQRIARVINIQRSPDSLKYFTTIATMLNPENIDNGYLDSKPPRTNMYYRVFIAFAGGTYAFSEVKRSGKNETASELTGADSIALKVPKPIVPIHNNYVYVGRDNNVIIKLPDAETKKYSIKFFNEAGNPVFELTKLYESLLTLEKVNFMHAGWYFYEVYEKERLVEKNKFYIPKDQLLSPPPIIEKGKKNR